MKRTQKLLFVTVALVLFSTVALCQSAPTTTRKNLGDINGDSIPEIAVEKTDWGVSSYSVDIKIMSGDHIILTLPTFSGDTADGYKVVGHQIVVWRGDWQSVQSKWKPHYYDFLWYKWDSFNKRFVQSREGFTKKSYSFKMAGKVMCQLAQNPGKNLVLSQGKSFADQALQAAVRKYRQKFNRVINQSVDEFGGMARLYSVPAVPAVLVYFKRDGRVEIRRSQPE